MESISALSTSTSLGAGGCSARLQVASIIACRAERVAVAADAAVALNPLPMTYLNRVSAHMFVPPRFAAAAQGGDILWRPGATR